MILKHLPSIQMVCKVYKNIDECNINKERKILIVFDDMIANIIDNKN